MYPNRAETFLAYINRAIPTLPQGYLNRYGLSIEATCKEKYWSAKVITLWNGNEQFMLPAI